MAFYTSTTEFPESTATRKVRLLAVNAGTGSVEVQYKCGNSWVTAEAFTTNTVKQMEVFGTTIRIVVTGNATFEYS